MNSKLLAAVTLTVMTNASAASQVTAPIQNLFDAMRAHDSEKLKAQFTSNALLQRAQADGTVTTTQIERFAQIVGESTSYLDEHLLAMNVHQSDNVATVFTPFAFYLDNKLSHCGINSFQLVKTQYGWKIHYLIDNKHPGNCEDFIKQYQ